MEVILLERIENLGQMGDVVQVKAGYARNYLLPQKKALRANKDNLAYFESQRTHLEAANLKRKDEAEHVGAKIDGASVTIIRQAGEAGHLYGSVTARDVATALIEAGYNIERRQVYMDRIFKELGSYTVRIDLHPEVRVNVTVNISRSQEEAAALAVVGDTGLPAGAEAFLENPQAAAETGDAS